VSDRRALGYRLLGRGFDYLLHLRPAEWPILTVHLLTGSALAVGMAGLLTADRGLVVLWGTLAFVIGLNGGTLALNSAFDRDEGDVAYLRKPPVPPRGLAAFGLLLMLGGLGLAATLPRPFRDAYALCLLLSVLYSVPPVRLKAVAGADWIINMVGFGFLTPFAGWALTGVELAGPGRTVLISFAFLFGALYPLTQLYQLEEDSRRGDRTLACVLGLDRSLLAAIFTAALAFTGFILAGVAAQWGGGLPGFTRWAALAAAGLAWATVLLPWWQNRADMDPAAHQAGMHRALAAWAITDMAVLYGFAR
jgi:4-hydroxybenzoate polyprenyltransferase